MLVRSVDDVDSYLTKIRKSAADVCDWMTAQTGSPIDRLQRMKFEPIGYHPIENHALNLAEQIYQTWTFAVALEAARQLLLLHPEADGYRLAPGAHAAIPLDIMSRHPGLMGAETFAAVHPKNNRKLARDLKKMSARLEQHRYIFFMSPLYPGANRLTKFETGGVQVWSVDI